MKYIFISFYVFVMLILTVSCSFGIKDDIPKNEVSPDVISSAVLAQIKADIIEKDPLNSEIDLEIDYSVSFSNTNNFPIKYDTHKITDLIFIKHNDPNNANMITVIKSANSNRYAKSIVKKLLDFQKSNSYYDETEKKKIENTLITNTGKYIIYITYDKPERIKDAIFETIQ